MSGTPSLTAVQVSCVKLVRAAIQAGLLDLTAAESRVSTNRAERVWRKGLPAIEIYVLYIDGVPAGFAELARSGAETELAYFGLLPAFIGRGIGGWLLRWSIARAWSTGPPRLWVHTCTLDHPRALGVYQQAGFAIYHRQERRDDDPRSRK